MKKTILIAAIAIATAFGSQAFAQEASTTSGTAQEQCLGKGCKAKKDGHRAGNRKGHHKDGGFRGMVDVTKMQDLNLTPQQVTAIEELNKKQAEEAKTAREAAKAQKADAERQRKEARDQRSQAYLSQLKSILTPEQYQKMLESRFMAKNSRGDRDMKQGSAQPGARSSRGNSVSAVK